MKITDNRELNWALSQPVRATACNVSLSTIVKAIGTASLALCGLSAAAQKPVRPADTHRHTVCARVDCTTSGGHIEGDGERHPEGLDRSHRCPCGIDRRTQLHALSTGATGALEAAA